MPFITLMTNLGRSALPADIMPRLIDQLAGVLKKPAVNFNWVLETDKTMSQGRDNSHVPVIWLKIEAVNSFREESCVVELTPKIYNSFTESLKIPEDQVIMTFNNLEPINVARLGKSLADKS
uniref:Macrophage migration inhibitory factor n=1 Tax=Pseudodiaptomus poplesia TaxID=213370 RepID=A0A1S6GL54_9MAXI|nr:macrophage migration inhibitory factor [Pseudodiaptomus poplesia]